MKLKDLRLAVRQVKDENDICYNMWYWIMYDIETNEVMCRSDRHWNSPHDATAAYEYLFKTFNLTCTVKQ